MKDVTEEKVTISFKEKRKKIKGVLFKFVPIMIKVIPGMTVLLILLKIVLSIVPVIQIYLVKETIDAVTALFNQQTESLLYTFQLLAFQGFLLVLSKIIQITEQLLGFRAQQKLKYHFEMLLIQKSSTLPLSYFDRPDYFDQLERAAFGMDIKGFSIFVLAMEMLKNCVSLIGMVYILISFHWVLVLCILLMLIPNLWVNAYFGQQKYIQMVQHTPTQRKTHYLLQLLHSRAAAKEIRTYNNASHLIERWCGLFWKTSDERFQLQKKSVWRTLIVDSAYSLLNIGIFGVLAWLGYQGSLTIGHYVSLTQALGQIQGMISDLGRNVAGIYEESLFVSEVMSYLELESEITNERKEKFPQQLTQWIEVDNLFFTYPSQAKPVLNGISFRIKPGEKIAIVGENGAGKSTLVKCLLGLYMPDCGTIRFDGIDIQKIEPYSMREKVTAVFQDYISYHLTVRENIAMGQLRNINHDKAIEEAASKAGAEHLLRQLPKGLDTELGPVFENGYELSGGQWQKIALSRAFMRDAQIVILDEPTAALDPRAEAEIYDNFSRLYEGKTTVMISHRLSSCRNADRIIVLQEGKIVEEGTHDELINLNGKYAQMFLSQAKRYTA